MGNSVTCAKIRLGLLSKDKARALYLFETKGNNEYVTLNDQHELFDESGVAIIIFEGTDTSWTNNGLIEDSGMEIALTDGKGMALVLEKAFVQLMNVKHFYNHYTVGRGYMEMPNSTAYKVDDNNSSFAPLKRANCCYSIG